MASKKIKTTVRKNGSVSTEFFGFVGDSCLVEESEIEKLLSGNFGIELPKVSQVRKMTSTQEETEKVKD